MRLFPKEVDVQLDEGFTPQVDIFGRKSFADQLTSIVSTIDGPLVIVLDAPWGEGKTTFVKMWAGELAKLNIPRVYFDAFANDYQQDAFIAISSYVIEEIERVRPADPRSKAFSQKAFKVAKVLGQVGLRVGVKALSAGFVEAEELKGASAEVISSLGEETEQALDGVLKARLENHQSDRQAFSSFRDSLRDLSNLLQTGKSDENSSSDKISKPMVFIIDELDRCKPSFALSILEVIKHFFSVEGIYFVLVTSLPQLESAVIPKALLADS